MTNATFPDLAGRSVFITGGGSGIGCALTRGFLAQNANVTFVQRSDATAFCDETEEVVGRRPHFLPCDVTDVAALHRAMDAAAERQGPITVLVNNAGNDQRHQMEDYTVEAWDASHAVNLRPQYFAVQKAVPGMRAHGGGAIVNYSSIAYIMGLAGMTAYVTAKAAITGMTRGLARELGPDNIRVNAVMPGWVLTPRQLDLWATPEGLAEMLDRQSLKRHLTEEDLVGPTLFLASRASAMVTGQAMVVDGGVVVTG
ncbi:MAG: SDR family oxidoreductase [Pseudomonadota bacterium]